MRGAKAAHPCCGLVEKLAGNRLAPERLANDRVKQRFPDQLLVRGSASAFDRLDGVTGLPAQLEVLHGQEIASLERDLRKPINEMIG